MCMFGIVRRAPMLLKLCAHLGIIPGNPASALLTCKNAMVTSNHTNAASMKRLDDDFEAAHKSVAAAVDKYKQQQLSKDEAVH